MSRTLVVIDGSNFYHGSKSIAPKVHLTSFGYRKLVERVIKNKSSRILYCVGEIRREKGNKWSEKLYAQQQSLFYVLEKQEIVIFKGFMLKSSGEYHEKGVDVRIAVELVKGAFKDEYDVCYLFSSDTDIIPAILEAREQKKMVVYVGFEGRMSRAMMKNCSRTKAVTKQMIVDCGS